MVLKLGVHEGQPRRFVQVLINGCECTGFLKRRWQRSCFFIGAVRDGRAIQSGVWPSLTWEKKVRDKSELRRKKKSTLLIRGFDVQRSSISGYEAILQERR